MIRRGGRAPADLDPFLKRSQWFVCRFESGARRWDGIEFMAVARALKVDPIDLFTRFVRS